jgi:glycosyltransferase involved in cell wall biosynthesis
LPPAYRERAVALIREQVPHVDGFIAVSEYCARFMEQFLGIPPSRLSVVPLGINMNGYEPAAPVAAGMGRREFRIGYFARVAPEKGLHVLADAYIRFRRRTPELAARLEIAGYLAPAHERYLADVQQTLQRASVGDECTYHGAVDRAGKLEFLRALDLLSVPATYDEPKGMFVLESMAGGVPVVQPRRGAFVEMVERTGGGVLVVPDDPERLADTFVELSHDHARLCTLSARASSGVRAHYTVAHSADRLLTVYRDVVARAQAVA